MKKLFCLISVLVLCFIFNLKIVDANQEMFYAATHSGELDMHISPGRESAVVDAIPACASFEVIETSGVWGLVVCENKSGWINLSFTRPSYDAAAEATGADAERHVKVKAKDSKASLYNLPDTHSKYGSEKLFSVPNGMILKIMRETESGWGLVSMNGKYAWIQLENVETYQTQNEETASKYEVYYVYALSKDGAGLSLYKDTEKSDILSVVPDCVRLTVRTTKDDCAYVSYGGKNGWIELEYTTSSESHAQMNAGEKVNAEYKIIKKEKENYVNIHSIPSESSDDSIVAGTVKIGEEVLVQRRTLDGWGLINHNGAVGWIPPGTYAPAEKIQYDAVTTYKYKKTGFIATADGKGAPLYAAYQKNNSYITVPECVQVSIIAEKEDRRYVKCDYASGWVENKNIVPAYDEALKTNKTEKTRTYILKSDTVQKTVPTEIALCGGENLQVLKAGTNADVSGVVVTDSVKWGLTKINGKEGWVNLTGAETVLYDYEVAIINITRILFGALILLFLIISIYKKRKRKITNE